MEKVYPRSLAQKLIAKSAGLAQVRVGDIVTCQVDLAMFHDSSGPRRLKPMLEELGASIWDKSKVALVIDHYVPEQDDDSRKIVRIARDWARDESLPHVFDSQGICHVVVPQAGLIKPGMFCVGGDSHSPTGGAFGAYMFGIGSTEMLGVMVNGNIWLRVPETHRMEWTGKLFQGVSAKDMILSMIGRLGMNGAKYQAVEFAGRAVQALSMNERMTLCNMSAELGAQAGLIAPDETTRHWLTAHGASLDGDANAQWCSDDGSESVLHTFDATALAPQIARPHSPSNVCDVTSLEKTPVQVAYLGACTGAKIDDIRAAASLVKNQRFATSVKFFLAPASLKDKEAAIAEGSWGSLMDAGAIELASSCVACAGYGNAIQAGVNVISSTARNFRGRMGAESTQVYLGSPYTVAASALKGYIADAREVLAT